MVKKLSLLLGAITVLASAAPAAASASALTMPAGTLVPLFTAVTFTSTNAITDTSIGNITCATVTLPGAVTKNSSGTFTIEGKGQGTSSTCLLNGTTAVTTTDITLFIATSSTSGSGKASLTYAADLAGVTCTYTASSTPFTYVSGSDTITFGSASTLTVKPAACGTATLTGNFTLETTSGGSVIID